MLEYANVVIFRLKYRQQGISEIMDVLIMTGSAENDRHLLNEVEMILWTMSR